MIAITHCFHHDTPLLASDVSIDAVRAHNQSVLARCNRQLRRRTRARPLQCLQNTKNLNNRDSMRSAQTLVRNANGTNLST